MSKPTPLYKDLPEGCAWGVFDKDGVKDGIGTINFLTQRVVLEAYKEIKFGETVQLDWSLAKPQKPFFGRKQFEHHVLSVQEDGELSCEDEIHINTQSSSQWDGLSHFGHYTTSTFYNGVKMESILRGKPDVPIGVDSWVQRGGIVGRGVMLDYVDYAQRKGIKYHPTDRHEIPLSVLQEMVEYQQVAIKPGDIVIVRTGLTEWYDNACEEDKKLADKGTFVGLEAGSKSAAWFWDHKVAAVASDTLAVEVWPPTEFDGHALHYHLIAMLGMPLGELWDLAKLARCCKRLNKYTFLVTSAPLNVPNGVASPPNAIALF